MIDGSNQTQSSPTDLILGPYRLSWTAYVGPVILALVGLFIARILYGFNAFAGIGLTLVVVLLLIYRIWDHRSLAIFADREGVWIEGGILPWTKGVNGVKWRDFDEAIFYQGFFSWAFKSFRVQVRHRYTKSSELMVPHLNRGDQAVRDINQHHAHLVRTHSLEVVPRSELY